MVRKVCLFYKIFKNQHSEYFFHLIPVRRALYATRNVHHLPIFKNIIFLKTLFSRILSLNGINQILAFVILKVFLHLRKIFFSLEPAANSVYNCHNPKGMKLITRFRLGLSHLREHKFKRNFQESLNPSYNCGHGIESTTHFFLHCPLFTNARYTLLGTLSSIDCNLLNNADFVLTQTVCLLIQIKI